MTIEYRSSDEDDVFVATSNQDHKISAGGGNNTITTLAGDDEIKTSSGDDLIDAGDGDNKINAGEGDNTVTSGTGDDSIKTSSGDDEIDAGEGDNRIVSGEGNDTVTAGAGDDDIKTSKGDDLILSGTGNDSIDGGDGIDTAVEGGSILDFTWSGTPSELTLVDESNGDTSYLGNMEFIQFDDFLFDLENNNGALIVGADQSTDEDTPISFDVSAYDFDGGDATLTSVAFSGMGTLSTMVADPDLVQNMGVGETISVSFDPGSDYDYLAVGDMVTETVTLSFEDGQGAVTSRSFDITITGVNDDPTASDSTGSVTEDATLVATGNVGAADVDQGTTLSYAVVGGGAGTYGALTVDGDGNWTYTLDNDAANVQALDTGDVEVDSFMIEVSDGDGGSTTVSVDIDVNGADDISLVPGTVGYYSMSSGMGRSAQVNEITQAGYAAQNITDLSASELAELPVLYVWNENNNGYGSEYLSNLANIEQAVAEGMTLIIHDRHVENAESILPGGAGFNIVRDFSDPADIDLLPGATGTIQSGPGGTLTDSTLDDGNYSTHGFAVEGSLPGDADLLLSRSADDEIVTFGYEYGEGYVIYSSIPLDFYSDGAGGPLTQAEAESYAANVIDYGHDVAFDMV